LRLTRGDRHYESCLELTEVEDLGRVRCHHLDGRRGSRACSDGDDVVNGGRHTCGGGHRGRGNSESSLSGSTGDGCRGAVIGK
jgi:hypothetical protein